MDSTPAHPQIARLLVALAILSLCLLGVILTDIYSSGDFTYWIWATPLIALLALGLSFYEHRTRTVFRPATLFHELLHWLGLIAAVFLVAYFYHLGVISRFSAGLFVLTSVGLTTYLAGVYIEISFLFLGFAIGLLACGVAFFEEYLYAFAIPFTLVAALILIGLHYFRKKSSPPPSSQIKTDS
ncbi:MAG: hypothetical protein KGJ02_03545 [Verrucomicrobiota bacterium]|nr:hypothetical protein [Verrucomicrobiota bacterium]